MTDLEMAKEAASDLGYLRDLAEEGRHAPLMGGRFAVMWGVLISAVLLGHWMIVTGQTSLGHGAIGYLWVGMVIIGGIGSAILGRSMKGKPGVGSVGNRAENAVWMASGFAIMAYWLAILAGLIVGKADMGILDTIMIMAFSIYGICYVTVGSLSGNRGMYGFAGLCFVAAIVNGALIHQPVAYLVAAIFVVLTTIVPGLLSIRREPSSIA